MTTTGDVNLYVMEGEWLRRNKIYAESGYPVYERWGAILAMIPEARYRSVSDDFSDVYRQAYQDWSGAKLIAAIDLTFLQMRWVMNLERKKIGLTHWRKWMTEATAVWRDRLMDRCNVIVPDHFEEDDDGEFVKFVESYQDGAIRHNWRH